METKFVQPDVRLNCTGHITACPGGSLPPCRIPVPCLSAMHLNVKLRANMQFSLGILGAGSWQVYALQWDVVVSIKIPLTRWLCTNYSRCAFLALGKKALTALKPAATTPSALFSSSIHSLFGYLEDVISLLLIALYIISASCSVKKSSANLHCVFRRYTLHQGALF